MKKVIVCFSAAFALIVMSVATASTNNGASIYNSSGFFISGNAGYGEFDFSKPSTLPTNEDIITNTGFAWNGNVGYQFNDYFALESGYTQFADVNANSPIPGGTLATENKDNYGIDLLAKGILPINHQFNLFAKAGAMRLYTKQVVSRLTFPDTSTTTSTVRYVPELGLGAACPSGNYA